MAFRTGIVGHFLTFMFLEFQRKNKYVSDKKSRSPTSRRFASRGREGTWPPWLRHEREITVSLPVPRSCFLLILLFNEPHWPQKLNNPWLPTGSRSVPMHSALSPTKNCRICQSTPKIFQYRRRRTMPNKTNVCHPLSSTHVKSYLEIIQNKRSHFPNNAQQSCPECGNLRPCTADTSVQLSSTKKKKTAQISRNARFPHPPWTAFSQTNPEHNAFEKQRRGHVLCSFEHCRRRCWTAGTIHHTNFDISGQIDTSSKQLLFLVKKCFFTCISEGIC